MQTVPNFGKVDEEMDIMAEEAETSRILFSAIGEQREPLDRHVTEMRARGLDVTGITVPRSGGGVGGLSANVMWWTPTWRKLNKLDFEARLAAIQDESFRAKLVAEVRDNEQTNRTRPARHQALVSLRRRRTAELHPVALREPRPTSRMPPASIRPRPGSV